MYLYKLLYSNDSSPCHEMDIKIKCSRNVKLFLNLKCISCYLQRLKLLLKNYFYNTHKTEKCAIFIQCPAEYNSCAMYVSPCVIILFVRNCVCFLRVLVFLSNVTLQKELKEHNMGNAP